MADTIERAVERAITAMRDNLGEPLTIDDIARAAMFSKFHFTRIFQRVTGLSPGRFLSALRLQHAKRLLVTTSWNVADISLRVGYASVGTFSSRFSRSVGMSPTTYRRTGGARPPAIGPCLLPEPSRGIVHGHIWSRFPGLLPQVSIGLFPSPIPEGRPASYALLQQPDRYVLRDVPEGTWHVLVCAAQRPAHPDLRQYDGECGAALGTYGPIVVRHNQFVSVNMWLRPRRVVDPPALLALFDPQPAGPLASGYAAA